MKFTDTTCKVLVALARPSTEGHYGLTVARDAGLKSGTLYPILARLEQNGLVVSEWEDIEEHEEGRRRRRYYRLTGPGVTAATVAAQRLVDRTPAWSNPGAVLPSC